MQNFNQALLISVILFATLPLFAICIAWLRLPDKPVTEVSSNDFD